MARERTEKAPERIGGTCAWCHHSPFRRTVHLLDMLDRGEGFEDVRRHLKTEFPHQAVEFHQAEVRSVETVRSLYGGQKDERNYRILPWVAWQTNKTSAAKIAEIKRWLRPELTEVRYEQRG